MGIKLVKNQCNENVTVWIYRDIRVCLDHTTLTFAVPFAEQLDGLCGYSSYRMGDVLHKIDVALLQSHVSASDFKVVLRPYYRQERSRHSAISTLPG